MDKVNLKCKHCGELYERRAANVKQKGAKYCSPKCSQLASRKTLEEKQKTQREYNQKYAAANRERIKKERHEYYLAHKEEYARRKKKSYLKNLEQNRESSLKRYHRNRARYSARENTPERIKQKQKWHFKKHYGPLGEPKIVLNELITDLKKSGVKIQYNYDRKVSVKKLEGRRGKKDENK